LAGTTIGPRHGPAVPGEVHRISLANARAQTMLGWRPRVALEEGLRLTVEWFKAEGSKRA